MVNEMLTGLIQIRIFRRRYSLLLEFAKILNQSFQVNICYWSLLRVFGVWINYFTVIIMWIGWIIGLAAIKPENAGLYGVEVVFLVQFGDQL